MTTNIDLQTNLNFWTAQLASELKRTEDNLANWNMQLTAAQAASPVNDLLVTYLTSSIATEQARTAWRQGNINATIATINSQLNP